MTTPPAPQYCCLQNHHHCSAFLGFLMQSNRRARHDLATEDSGSSPSTGTSPSSGPDIPVNAPQLRSNAGKNRNTPHDGILLQEISLIFEARVQELPVPQCNYDLFAFDYKVTKLLASRPETECFLRPLGTDADATTQRLSRLCYDVIWAHLPEGFIPREPTLVSDTYALLQRLRARIPAPYDHRQCPAKDYEFPTRKKTETMDEYLDRFELWKARFLPIDNKGTLYFCATFMWLSHSIVFDLDPLYLAFDSVVKEFQTTDELMHWFQQEPRLQPRLVEPKGLTNATRQGQKGNRKNEGSTQSSQHKARPVFADRDNSTDTNALVIKNGVSKSKSSKKKRKTNHVHDRLSRVRSAE